MGVGGVIFDPYALADKPVVDIAFIQGATIKRDFFVSVQNAEAYTLYAKLISNIPNWSFEGVSYKLLGAVGGGAKVYYPLHFWRAKPTPEPGTDLVDSGNLRIELYNDSEYTDYYGGDDLPVDMRVVYLMSFTNIQQWTFSNGTEQGWTLDAPGLVSDSIYFGVTGYAPNFSFSVPHRCTSMTANAGMEKIITLPNTSKVFGKMYVYMNICAMEQNGYIGGWFRRVSVKFNGAYVYDMPSRDWVGFYWYDYNASWQCWLFPWNCFVFDLSDYRGQTGILRLETEGRAYAQYGGYQNSRCGAQLGIDMITIGGK